MIRGRGQDPDAGLALSRETDSFEAESAEHLRRRLRIASGTLLAIVGAIYVLPKLLHLMLSGGDVAALKLLHPFNLLHFVSWFGLLHMFRSLGRGDWPTDRL